MAKLIQRDDKSRFTDLHDEPIDHLLSPIKRYQEEPLVSLIEAIEPVANLFKEIKDNIFVALHNCQSPADGLTQQESASIHLYTMPFDSGPHLYALLNHALRAENREELTPWQSFLKLFLTALHKLPSETGTIWRGVHGADLVAEYKVGTKFPWWGVSSCTKDIEVLESKALLGKHGTRTLFSIECINGKSIGRHSYYKNTEKEIILMPGSYFEVIDQSSPSPDLHIIKLKEISPPIALIKPPFVKSKEFDTLPTLFASSLFTSPTLTPESLPSLERDFHRQKTSPRSVISDNLADIRWVNKNITVAGGQGYGYDNNQMKNPLGICFDGDDQSLIIADCFNHRIVQWRIGDKAGHVVAGGHGQGARLEQLDSPTDVLIERDTNSLIIADSGNRRVVRWPRRSDATQGEILLDNIHCYGLALDYRGFLYVSDIGRHEVRRYIVGVGVKSGTLVAGGHGRGTNHSHLNEPTYIFVDQYQAVYISDKRNHRVMKWGYNATEGIVVAGDQGQGDELAQLSSPNGLYVDRSENVCVVDSGNNRVMRWVRGAAHGTIIVDGNVQREAMSLLHGPTGLVVDSNANLYVSDSGNGRVQRFPLE